MNIVVLLLAGFVTGVLAATLALLTGFGWLSILGFYALGGNIGLMMTALLIALGDGDDRVLVSDD